MDERAARRTLGVADDASWDDVRAAYRVAIRRAHPDIGGSTTQAATLNTAYAVLVRARRDRATAGPRLGSPVGSPVGPPAGSPIGPVEVLDGDTLRLSVPPDEAFALLVEAGHRIGHVTYVDRSCAIFETLVDVPGEGACSLVVTLQGRATGTEAFCTLEAIEHVGSPPVTPIVAALREVLAHWDHG